jgi:hypothetical protein
VTNLRERPLPLVRGVRVNGADEDNLARWTYRVKNWSSRRSGQGMMFTTVLTEVGADPP